MNNMYLSRKDIDQIEIALKDVLKDLQCSKEQMVKRVTCFIDYMEKRKAKEVHENSLITLKSMFKMDLQLKKKDQQMFQLQKLITKLEKQRNKNSETIEQLQEKLNEAKDGSIFKDKLINICEDRIRQLQSKLKQSSMHLKALQAEKGEFYKWKEQYGHHVIKTRQKYNNRIEQQDMLMQTQQRSLTSSFVEVIENLRTKTKLVEQKVDIERKRVSQEKKIILEMQSKAKQLHLQNAMLQKQISLNLHANDSNIKSMINFVECQSQTDAQIKPTILQEQKVFQVKTFGIFSYRPKLKLQIRQVQASDQQIQTQQTLIVQTNCEQVQTQSIDQKPDQNTVHYCEYAVENENLYKLMKDLDTTSKSLNQLHKQKYDEIIKIYVSRPSREEDILSINQLKGQKMGLQIKINELKAKETEYIKIIDYLLKERTIKAHEPKICFCQQKEQKIHDQEINFMIYQTANASKLHKQKIKTEENQRSFPVKHQQYQIRSIKFKKSSTQYGQSPSLKNSTKSQSLFEPRHFESTSSGIFQRAKKYKKYSLTKKQSEWV